MYSLYAFGSVLRTHFLIFRVKHEKGYAICGLAWHPSCGRIAYTDAEGNLGLLENVCEPSGKTSSSKVISNSGIVSSKSFVVIWVRKTPQNKFFLGKLQFMLLY